MVLPNALNLSALNDKFSTKEQITDYLRKACSVYDRKLFALHDISNETKRNEDGITLKLLSYNMLAQCLAKSSMFPKAGKLTSWKHRNQFLALELLTRDADVICLQEVDVDYLDDWVMFFEKFMNCHCEFSRYGTKRHGIFIAYSLDKFKKDCVYSSVIDFDKEMVDVEDEVIYNGAKITKTNNIAMVMAIDFNEEYLDTVQQSKKVNNGILIGTAHLFWHPFGTFERTRQTYILLKKLHEMKKMYKEPEYKSFFMGDFNAQPYLAPYEAMVLTKPIDFSRNKKSFYYMNGSMEYNFAKERSPFEFDPSKSKVHYIPENIEISEQLSAAFNKLPIRAISLYGHSYKKVDSRNSLKEYNNEPQASNSNAGFKGMLDYIFLIVDEPDLNVNVNSKYSQLDKSTGVCINKLLEVPLLSDLPSNEEIMFPGVSGSDHFSLYGEVTLLEN
ncbi:uncharacterized protein HGUI_02744 [Hanseniaspora guilliermondii]|uniref:Endonuclease/exonuclease/phosphatase domain-containing protein n=1 Tax=Hanseniaspora guilliermondii TaxID=56406 RepID=A0A1L0B271_9ASCO|nr:uncharacterized protein HGUI_02744 [Hanseniaspora guilliermondii]